jgi:hypothetical protein
LKIQETLGVPKKQLARIAAHALSSLTARLQIDRIIAIKERSSASV